MTEAIKQYCKGVIVGKLKEVPQIRTSKKGAKYCMFKLEVKGEKFSSWFDFQAWGEKAEEMCLCKCGSIVGVKFPLKNNEYTDKNGQKQKQTFSPDAFGEKYEITIISQPEKEEISKEEDPELDSLPF